MKHLWKLHISIVNGPLFFNESTFSCWYWCTILTDIDAFSHIRFELYWRFFVFFFLFVLLVYSSYTTKWGTILWFRDCCYMPNGLILTCQFNFYLYFWHLFSISSALTTCTGWSLLLHPLLDSFPPLSLPSVHPCNPFSFSLNWTSLLSG